MPTIIKGLNITKDPVYSQLLTVPVVSSFSSTLRNPVAYSCLQYLIAALSFIIGARMSDHYRIRSIPLLVYGAIMIVGCESGLTVARLVIRP